MRIRALGIASLAFAAGIAGCLNIESTTTSRPLDPVKMQSYLARNFSHMPIVYDGLARLISAANGTVTPGVTFTNITGGVQGSIGYDLDGNGSRESSINAKLIYNNPAVGINSGATFTVTSIDAPYLDGTATAALSVAGGGTTVTITSGTADLKPTNGPEITIPSVSLTISPTLSTPTVLGHADFSADNKTGTIFFETATTGGWKMRVTSSSFATFTVP